MTDHGEVHEDIETRLRVIERKVAYAAGAIALAILVIGWIVPHVAP